MNEKIRQKLLDDLQDIENDLDFLKESIVRTCRSILVAIMIMIVLSMVCIIWGRRQFSVVPVDEPNKCNDSYKHPTIKEKLDIIESGYGCTSFSEGEISHLDTIDTFDTNNLSIPFTSISVTDGNETYSLTRTDSNGIVYDPNIIEGFLLALYKGFMEVEPNGIILTKEK